MLPWGMQYRQKEFDFRPKEAPSSPTESSSELERAALPKAPPGPSEALRSNKQVLDLYERIGRHEVKTELTVPGLTVERKPATWHARVESQARYGFRLVSQVTKEGHRPNAELTSKYSPHPIYLLAGGNPELGVVLRFEALGATLHTPRSHEVFQLCLTQEEAPLLEELLALARERCVAAPEAPPLQSDTPTSPARTAAYFFSNFSEYRRRLLGGETTAAEHREEFRRLLQAKDAFVEDLVARHSARELRDLATRFGSFCARGETKRENAEAVYRGALGSFVLGEAITYSPFSGETFEGAAAKLVNETTDESLREYVKMLSEAQSERHQKHAERKATLEKALTHPETLFEFELFVREKGGEEALTLEQLALFDRLRADTTRVERESSKHSATVERIDAEGVSFTLTRGFHEKRGVPLWIVGLKDRVEKDTYRELLSKAKALGGWYSSFVKDQAGFQFLSEEAAKKFVGLLSSDVDRSDLLTERAHDKKLRAGERLLELADSLETSAKEALSQDRLTNTARRADMAAGIRGRARTDLALSETTRRIGEALERGEATYLDGIRHRSQVSLLVSLLRRAVYARSRAERKAKESEHNAWDSWHDPDDLRRRPPTEADIPFLEYPHPVVHARCMREVILRARNVPGVKQAARHLKKHLDGGEDLIEFKTEHDVKDLMDFVSRAESAHVDTSWMGRSLDDLKRLRAANLWTLPELRAAARELLPHLKSPGTEDPIEVLERELIGKKLPGFFPTPPRIISRMLELAGILPGQSVLEPSCGKGDIMDAIAREHPGASLLGIELSRSLHDILAAKGHEVLHGDFLEHEGTYDRILMNPPFEGGADIEHVRHAYELLSPGGRLVSVMSEGPFFRADSKAQGFRAWLEALGATTEELPEGSFTGKEAFRETSVATRLVVIEKGQVPGAEPPRIAVLDRGNYAEPPVVAQAVNALGDSIGPSVDANSVDEAVRLAREAYAKRPFRHPRSP